MTTMSPGWMCWPAVRICASVIGVSGAMPERSTTAACPTIWSSWVSLVVGPSGNMWRGASTCVNPWTAPPHVGHLRHVAGFKAAFEAALNGPAEVVGNGHGEVDDGHVYMFPRASSRAMICIAASCGVLSTVCMTSSGFSGGSYGSEMPVKLGISPVRAFLYMPLGSRSSHTSSRGVDEYFDEVFVFHEFAHAVAVGAIGAYKAGEGDDTGVGKEFADFADAADVFSAVFG